MEEEQDLFPLEAGFDFDAPKYLKYPSQNYSSFIPPSPSSGCDIFSSAWEEKNNRYAHRVWKEEGEDYQRAKLMPSSSKGSHKKDKSNKKVNSKPVSRVVTSISFHTWTPKVPVKVQLLGFIENGCLLIRLNDKATREQYQLYEDNISYVLADTSKPMKWVNVPLGNFEEGSLVFARAAADPTPKYIRAVVIEMLEEKAVCKDLDTWIQKTIPFQDIYYMPPTFLEVPFLVQQCRLKDIEFWSVDDLLQELSLKLPPLLQNGEIVKFSRKGRGEEQEEDIPIVKVNVQLGKSLSAEDGCKDLSNLFTQIMKRFNRKPRQFTRGDTIERVHINMVNTSGYAWIYFQSPLATRLTHIGEDPPKIMSSNKFNPFIDIEDSMTDFEYAFKRGDRTFLARFYEDRNLFRVEIQHFEMGDTEVQAYYIDFGNTETIPVEDVIPCELVDPLINQIPPQVCKAKLFGIKGITDVDEFFEHFAIQNEQYIKIVGFERDSENKVIPQINAYIVLNEAAPKNWTFVNEAIIEKNLGTIIYDGILEEKDVKMESPQITSTRSYSDFTFKEGYQDEEAFVAIMTVKEIKRRLKSF